MLRQLKRLWNKHIVYKDAKLTPKGECFKSYCEQIVNKNLKNRLAAYEEFIYHIAYMVAEDYGIILNREETAEFILASYEEIL